MGDDTAGRAAIADGLRAWAKGMYATEAAVELLIRHRKAVYDGAPWIRHEGGRVWLDADALRDGAGAWSSGERDVVDIALSLLGEHPVDLSDVLAGLDRRNLQLVIAALAHAAGSHEHSELVVEEDGSMGTFTRLPALYPWPEDQR